VKRLIICIVGITFFIFPVVSVCNAQTQSEDTKMLFEKKCSACHGIKKATGQKKNQAEWADTVLRMKNKHGAPVNESEAKSITDYLAKNYVK
jgi:cytochrome c5